MIIVTGTKRSGTSLWMHILTAAGFPLIGERFPLGWGELLRDSNPDGHFESELLAGIYYRTNPHPLTGAYLAPQQTRSHVVKVLIPGLVRTDIAYIDRCVATVRSWREYVVSMRRIRALQASDADPPAGALPLALEWWCQNFALLRDLAVRGYPIHVVSYDALLRDPARVAREVLAWLGREALASVSELVRPTGGVASAAPMGGDDELAEGISAHHRSVFDTLYQTIDRALPLSASLVAELNRTDEALRPLVLEHRAHQDASVLADLLASR